MMNRKLPKKYLKKNTVVAPVNAYVPPQSKLSPEELDKQLEQEAIARKQKEQALKEKQQKEMNLDGLQTMSMFLSFQSLKNFII